MSNGQEDIVESSNRPNTLQAVSRQGELPLSFAQERIWFLQQWYGPDPTYNEPAAIRLRGRLDREALRRTIEEIVRRHEVLRTSYAASDGKPRQIIHPPMAMDLPLLDLSHLPPPTAEAQAMQLAREEAARPFDLGSAPMVRARLVKLPAQTHLLLITMHHIASDGWSGGVLLDEMARIYGAHANGLPSPLPALPLQYADYAAWQRQSLPARGMGQLLDWWKDNLAGAPNRLELPSDFQRPKQETRNGGRLEFHLPSELGQGLKKLAQQNQATVYQVLLAGFFVLLHRYSGQEDIVVGSPVAGRNRPELESLVGFFVNSLALRGDLSGDPSFLALLARVRLCATQALAHQELPFERLVAELQPERDLSHAPIFQVMFALQNTPRREMEMQGLGLESVAVERGTAKFELVLFAWEERGIRCLWEYNSDLFRPDTIARVADHFQHLLQSALDNPNLPISRLRMMDQAERRLVLEEFNPPASPYPRDSNLAARFAEIAHKHAQGAALVQDEQGLAYGELDRLSNRLAHRLVAMGVAPGARVGICLERGFAAVAGILGIIKAGAAYVPLDPEYPADRLRFMLEDTQAQVVLCQEGLAGPLPAQADLLYLRQDWLRETDDSAPGVEPQPDWPACVMYTSGSTGHPKGVQITHRNILRLVCDNNYGVLDSRQVLVNLSNMSFDALTLEVWGALLNGARLAIPKHGKLSIEDILEVIGRHGVTFVWITAGLLREIMARGLAGLSPLRQLFTGGEVVGHEMAGTLLEAFPRLHLVNGYGPTENTTFTTCQDLRAWNRAGATVPIGRPVNGSTVYILDRHGEPAPLGVPGELYCGGDGVAAGYLNRPELNAERFVPNPFGPGRLYKSGDLARWLPNGTLEFLGRRDHQVKVRGFRVELGEIEAVLNQCELVEESLVVTREEEIGGKRIVAYVRPARQGREKGQSHLAQWQSLFQHAYGELGEEADPAFDISGWQSSYSGLPIDPDEMREWVECTVAELTELAPSRVLEIGCGTGLLLSRLAPACQVYQATDYSSRAVEQVERLRAGRPDLAHLRVEQREAADFSGLAPGYDLIILNSIVQYFPDGDYLRAVLAGAADLLAPGGRLYVGDVRSLPLLPAYHASVQLHQAREGQERAELAARVRAYLDDEEELAIAPDFFQAFAAQHPKLGAVQVQIKRGRAHNELTRFRYQVVMQAGPVQDAPQPAQLVWRREVASLSDLGQALGRARGPVLVGEIPNARLIAEARALSWLESGHGSVGDLRQELASAGPGVEPQDLWELAAGLGMGARLCYPASGRVDAMDALFLPAPVAVHPTPWSGRSQPWRQYLNNPMLGKERRAILPKVRAQLESKLPAYMQPAAYVLLDAWPLNANGKVDRAALPAPDWLAQSQANGAPPRGPLEEKLAGIWQEVLGLSGLGREQNFFELGGHSLLATQIISRARRAFDCEIPLKTIFEAPTIEKLAARIAELSPNLNASGEDEEEFEI